MADSVYMEGWLIRSRERSMRFPPFKSKWVRRYFVLRICDKRLGTYVLDEFRHEDKRRLRKSLDLVRCVQIDSHLQLADSSCSTTSRFGGFQWIFSMYFSKELSSQKKTPLYFVSESEEKMKDWVYNLCRACRLEKEDGEDNNSYLHQHHSHMEAPSHRSTIPSSVGGLSIYSDRSSESMLDTPRSEISRDLEVCTSRSAHGDDYLHDFEFVYNPKRVSRFNSRLCMKSLLTRHTTLSTSNPVTPFDAVVLLSRIHAVDKSFQNQRLRDGESTVWKNCKQGCSFLRHWFSQNFGDIFRLPPFILHLKRKMNTTSARVLHAEDDLDSTRDASKTKRQHPRWKNLRHDIAHRNVRPSTIEKKNNHPQRHRRAGSLEGRCHSSSPSVCSSVTSDRRSNDGDDDSTSCISQLSNLSCGPPIPPRSRLVPQYSSASSSTSIPVKRLPVDYLSHMAFPAAHRNANEPKDNDSSGETIKMYSVAPYANSQCSSDDRLRAPVAFQPPAVDRSNKPAKLRLYEFEEVKMGDEMTIHDYNKSGSNFTRTPRTPQAKTGTKYTYMREPPKSAGPLGRSRELDYFNPVVLDRAHSLRSPVSSDIEYIKIDAEKTQAVKQSIAQRTTIE